MRLKSRIRRRPGQGEGDGRRKPALSAPVTLAAAIALGLVPLLLADEPARPSTPRQPAEGSAAPPGDADHGRYLVEQVAMCAECHSTRDEDGTIIEEQRFMGGPVPVRPPWPNDWARRAPRNRGLPGYTVEEGIRLLTEGAIGADGRQLRPPMPRFRMTREDAADVVAYLKSLE